MRWRSVAIVLGLAARPVGAEPPAAPIPAPAVAEDPVGAAALAVEDAVRGKAAPRLAELAASDDPDPWLVADRLCEHASFDAAAAFAAAERARPDVERLAAYVAQQRARPSAAPHRAGLAVVATARAEERWEDGLRALDKVGATSDDVTGVRLDAERARLLLGAARGADALRRPGRGRRARGEDRVETWLPRGSGKRPAASRRAWGTCVRRSRDGSGVSRSTTDATTST